MREKHAARYSGRINKVLDYIHAHLDEELSVDTLSRIAHFSRFHFHRQFSDYTGITVTRLVQMLRLRRASLQLVFNKRARITDIAFQAGFANAESFSRAFRREHGQTPTEFRSNPKWVPWQSAWLPHPAEERQWNVELCEFPAIHIAVIEHRGPREQVPIAMAKLFEWRQANARKYDLGGVYGIYPCDPERTPPEQLRIEFAAEVDRPVAPDADGIHNKLIPEGRCAVLRNVGAYQAQNAIRWLFREWLPGSGEQLRDFPLYCHFITADANAPENKKAVDVYVPLR